MELKIMNMDMNVNFFLKIITTFCFHSLVCYYDILLVKNLNVTCISIVLSCEDHLLISNHFMLQNKDGTISTYECARTSSWIEVTHISIIV